MAAGFFILRKQARLGKTQSVTRVPQFHAYAPPDIWGMWTTISSHVGSVSYEISYSAVGNTLVVAQVRYWQGPGNGTQTVEDFRDDINVDTADCVGNVEVRFKGVPTGSAVDGSISP